jgi:phosphoglycolate phosphatase
MTDFDFILFDLDGTLTDSAPGITRSVQYALRGMGLPADDPDQFRSFIGPPLEESFRRYLHSDGATARQAVEKYREYYTRQGIFENSVHPGIPELLDALRGKGKLMAVATSKPTVFTECILDHFHLRKYFSVEVGSRMDGSRVEKKEIIAEVLSQARGMTWKLPVMVGDRMHDIIGAHLNRIPAVAVTWGYGSREELDLSQPEWTVNSVPELLALLTGGIV